uniref:Uncharacterized protein n=1 Tax=Pectinophora gossypiella TaxID=13191 RepID=A0A1E1WLL8_PECGO
MNLYNNYMENLKKSRRVALGLLEDNKDLCEDEDDVIRNSPADINVEAGPSTSQDKPKRPTEFVKYGKITFNTTAILHHYPQLNNKTNGERHQSVSVATKKSDLNLVEVLQDNNNDETSENKEVKVAVSEDKSNGNTNETPKANGVVNAKVNCVVKSDNTIEVLKNPVKFTEEKLV